LAVFTVGLTAADLMGANPDGAWQLPVYPGWGELPTRRHLGVDRAVDEAINWPTKDSPGWTPGRRARSRCRPTGGHRSSPGGAPTFRLAAVMGVGICWVRVVATAPSTELSVPVGG
jgi:hypothetical protein